MIWLCWLRTAPLPGCKQLPESGSDALECAVSAEHPDEIRSRLDAALHSHRFSVRELEACVAFEPSDWTDETDPDSRVRAAVAIVEENPGVQFASFGCPPPTIAAARMRAASLEDRAEILALYRRVASTPGGLARLAHEIDEPYVADWLGRAHARGLCLVAANSAGRIEAEIHACTPVPTCFHHVLSELTIAVDPASQGDGVGRRLFRRFLEVVIADRPTITRVELIARASNRRAIALYESLGFRIEGELVGRIRSPDGELESDIPMAWMRS